MEEPKVSRENKNRLIFHQEVSLPPEQQVLYKCEDEDGVFCSDFSNLERDFDLEGLKFFTSDPENPRILKTNLPKKGIKDNPNLWIKNLMFIPEIRFSLTAKLHDDEKGNLTIVYGSDWRCIIGESGFNAITCESCYSNRGKKERKTIYLTSEGHLPIQPETELILKGSTALIKDDYLKITLSLDYFNTEDKREQEDFDFELKFLSSDPHENERKFGVGIIDPNDEGIRIEFLRLEIKDGL